MSDDLVKRLEDGICDDKCKIRNIEGGCTCAIAADRIEALEAHVAKQQMDIVDLGIMAGRTLTAEARIKALEEGLRFYSETFCEFPHNLGCGKYDDERCGGCRARALLGGSNGD